MISKYKIQQSSKRWLNIELPYSGKSPLSSDIWVFCFLCLVYKKMILKCGCGFMFERKRKSNKKHPYIVSNNPHLWPPFEHAQEGNN